MASNDGGNWAEEVFGTGGQRPESREFWQLADILLRLDGAMEAAPPQHRDAIYEREVHKRITDQRALTYVAMQRAFRSLGIETQRQLQVQMSKDPQVMFKLMTLWCEGFMVGAEYAAANAAELRLALRAMLDGFDALVEDDQFEPLESAAAEAKKAIGEGK
jgi:hypothetical protein